MVSPREMELLSRQLNQAHRAAVQAELTAAGETKQVCLYLRSGEEAAP